MKRIDLYMYGILFGGGAILSANNLIKALIGGYKNGDSIAISSLVIITCAYVSIRFFMKLFSKKQDGENK